MEHLRNEVDIFTCGFVFNNLEKYNPFDINIYMCIYIYKGSVKPYITHVDRKLHFEYHFHLGSTRLFGDICSSSHAVTLAGAIFGCHDSVYFNQDVPQH